MVAVMKVRKKMGVCRVKEREDEKLKLRNV